MNRAACPTVPMLLNSLFPGVPVSQPVARPARTTPRSKPVARSLQFGRGPWMLKPGASARTLTTDFDGERLRCWPRLSTARAELVVAKAMCSGFLFAAAAIAMRLQAVLA